MNSVTEIDTRLTSSRSPNQDVSRDPGGQGNADEVIAIARAAKQASRILANLPTAAKDEALSNIAEALERHCQKIFAANAEDVKQGEALVASGELSRALFKRLGLNQDKLRAMIDGVLAVRDLPDPSGRLLTSTLLDAGPEPGQYLRLDKVSCPLGVLAIIFEARPDAITQISSLAIKSGNAVILKGGKEVERTMRAILEVIRGALSIPLTSLSDGLATATVPADAVCGVYGREAVQTLLGLVRMIDLVIPRGSNALVQYIQRNTQIPVLGHADGVCHIFIDRSVDRSANFDRGIAIVIDSKIQYPAVCNAVETVLVDAAIAGAILPPLYAALHENGVKVRGDAGTRAILPNAGIDLVGDDEWHTEYSDLILAIRVVDSLDAAMEHIEQHGSHHTDAILTEDAGDAERFLNEVDSANVLLNCSTRFSDGFRYGFGAEVGISTSKLHARGPVGLDGLVTYKYKVIGAGQVVRDYAGDNARPFLHRRLT